MLKGHSKSNTSVSFLFFILYIIEVIVGSHFLIGSCQLDRYPDPLISQKKIELIISRHAGFPGHGGTNFTLP